MIRLTVTLAAYQAIASTLPKGSTARAPEAVPVGDGVGLWVEKHVHAALERERRAGEGWSEVILRLTAAETASGPVEVARRVRGRRLAKGGPNS